MLVNTGIVSVLVAANFDMFDGGRETANKRNFGKLKILSGSYSDLTVDWYFTIAFCFKIWI